MFDSLHKRLLPRCGVIVDIGSGSVGISIVLSHPREEAVEVVWSHREYSLIKDIDSIQVALKGIRTALVNAFLELGSSGLKTLREHELKPKVGFVQTSVAAPWAYTVTRTINYQDEHPFEVTQEMLNELIDAAKKQSEKTVAQKDVAQKLGLQITNSKLIGTRINGYSVIDPIGKTGRSLQVTHLQGAIQDEILETLDEVTGKILPHAKVTKYPFMYVFYRILEDIQPDTSEICLVDVTSESTEIGIIREGTLRHVTHTNFGMYTLAREIAQACNIPKEEAYTFMKDSELSVHDTLNTKMRSELEIVFNAYEQKIADMYKQTGDTLSIPKSIFLHTDEHVEDFFAQHIKKAATLATGNTHVIHRFTSQLLNGTHTNDSALAVSHHFFHTHRSFDT